MNKFFLIVLCGLFSSVTIATEELDISSSIKVVQQAVKGNPDAQNRIGIIEYNVSHNYSEAFKWFNKASEQGHPWAEYNLGFMYLNGKGVERNIQKSFDYLYKSATKNIPDAQYLLGTLYEDSLIDGEKDLCVSWYKKSAKTLPLAQYKLGVLYENGNFVEKNLEMAKYFYELATNANFSDADKRLENVNIQLSKLKSKCKDNCVKEKQYNENPYKNSPFGGSIGSIASRTYGKYEDESNKIRANKAYLECLKSCNIQTELRQSPPEYKHDYSDAISNAVRSLPGLIPSD